MTLLITGATGQVGSAAARALVVGGHRVRALVRSPQLAQDLAGVELVPGRFEDDAALDAALRGVHALLLIGHDNPDYRAQMFKVMQHAWDAGVAHIVRLSALGARPHCPVHLMADHAALDERLQAGPARWTLLRPHLYMQNLLRSAAVIARTGELAAPMAQEALPLVDARDVGAAAAAILAEPDAHAGRSYALTGPAAVTHDEVAGTLARVLGRPVRYAAQDAHTWEAQLRVAGTPGWRAFDLANILLAYRRTDQAVQPDLAQLLGRPATPLEAFVQDHRQAFCV